MFPVDAGLQEMFHWRRISVSIVTDSFHRRRPEITTNISWFVVFLPHSFIGWSSNRRTIFFTDSDSLSTCCHLFCAEFGRTASVTSYRTICQSWRRFLFLKYQITNQNQRYQGDEHLNKQCDNKYLKYNLGLIFKYSVCTKSHRPTWRGRGLLVTLQNCWRSVFIHSLWTCGKL